MIYLHQNILYWRERNRYTQQEVADILKIKVGAIKSYELKKATPPLDIIIRYAKAMHVSLDTLILVRLNDRNFIGNTGIKREEIPVFEKRIQVIEKRIGVSPGVSPARKY